MATATPVCSLENYLVLPDNTMDERIAAAREALGRECVVLGHHYQRDEVIRYADFRGDSYKLAQEAAHAGGKYIVFCGVHFMAESADILSRPGQVTILPDLNAGCSMADMAEITQVETCWEHLVAAGLTDDSGEGITPITYMNSAAAIKAFCGERKGVVCTSSNAVGAFQWGFAKTPKLLFLPDQHLGRNTGYNLGIPLSEMVVWDPYMLRRRPDSRAFTPGQGDPVERPLLRPSTLPARACGQRSRQVSRDSCDCASGVPLGSLPESRWHWLYRGFAEDYSQCAAGQHVCSRH